MNIYSLTKKCDVFPEEIMEISVHAKTEKIARKLAKQHTGERCWLLPNLTDCFLIKETDQLVVAITRQEN